SARPHCELLSFPTRRSSDLLLHNDTRLPKMQRLAQALDSTAQALSPSTLAHQLISTRITWVIYTALLILYHPILVLAQVIGRIRSEEHTSELQSRENLVCRL